MSKTSRKVERVVSTSFIADCLNAGRSISEVAEYVGVSESKLKKRLRDSGFRHDGKNWRIN